MAKAISKEELKEPDSFVQFFESLIKVCKKNARNIWIILGLFVVGLIAYFVIQHNQEKMNLKAANAYATVLENHPLESVEGASVGKWQAFETEVVNFLQTYPKSTMAPMMKVHHAKALLSLGKYDESIAAYQEAGIHLAAPYNFLALEGKAVAMQQAQKWDESLQVWKALAENPENPFQDNHLWNLGLTHEQLGDAVSAVEAYQKIENDFQDSFYLTKAKAQKALIEK